MPRMRAQASRLPVAMREGVFVAWVALAIALLPRGSGAQNGEALLAADRIASEASARSGFAGALLENLHPGGVLLWPGAPVVIGPADVRRLLEAQPVVDSLHLAWQPLAIEIARDSTLGATWGIAVATARAGGVPAQIGRYIAVWQPQHGRWRIVAFLLIGLTTPQSTVVPAGLALELPAAKPASGAKPFVDADLAFARLAADRGAAVAFARWAAPQATMFGAGGVLVRGPEAIGALVDGPASWQWHPVAAGAATTGDLGWTVGEAVITPPDAEPFRSKYLTLWTRLPDGAVRFLADGGNARPTRPAGRP